MADVFNMVRAFMLADPAINGLVATRIYPIKPPQAATYPLVTMQEIAEESFHHLRGSVAIEGPHYQIDAWVREGPMSSFELARTLARFIKKRLDGKSVDLTHDGETFRVDMLFEAARDLFETETGGGFYRRSSDYVIGHRPITT